MPPFLKCNFFLILVALHSHSLFVHHRKSTQITSKVCKYFLACKRDVQVIECECIEQDAKKYNSKDVASLPESI